MSALRRGGIHPSAVLGHSSGEIAAAYAAGVLSLQAAIIIAYYRGFITKGQTTKGGMAAVGLGADEVTQFLSEGVIMACENSSSSTTISGDLDALDAVVKCFKKELPDVFVRKLKVNMAYHSRESFHFLNHGSVAHEPSRPHETFRQKLPAIHRRRIP